jgi:chorismate dehydratase
MVQKSRVKVGAVSYLNTKPLIYALSTDPPLLGGEEIDLSLAAPSRLADDLRAGSIDIGLIPIIEYLRAGAPPNARRYRIIPDISISSHGAVLSIQLLSHVPIPAIRSVALDASSRTSQALVQILLAEKYGVSPAFTSCPPTIDPRSIDTDAVLLIGDAALKHIGTTAYALDLGAEWHELTGLPFVYACWVAREGADLRNVPKTLRRAKEIGMSQIPKIARIEARKLGFPEELCLDYLTRRIFFDLGESEIAGLLKYYALAVKYDLAKPGVELRFV